MNNKKEITSALPYLPNLRKDHAVKNCKNIKNQLIQLLSELDSIDVIILLTAKSVAINMIIKETEKNIFNETPALQFLIDICLSFPYSHKKTPSISDINRIYNMIEEYFHNLSYTPSENENELNSENQFTSHARLQSSLSEINKEKYPFQIKEHIQKIYFKINLEFEKKFGFSISNAEQFSEKMIESGKKRIANIIVKKYDSEKKRELSISQTIDNLTKTIAESGFSIFNITELCKQESEIETRWGNYITSFSCKFGEGKIPENTYSKFLIDHKPIILLEDGRIFCPLLEFAYWNIPLMVEKLLEEEKISQTPIWQKLKNAKKVYMEEKIVTIFAKVFPREKIHKNLYYEFNGRRESDVLIEYDNKILIVEAKSGLFSEKAFQGKAIRIKSDLEKILEKPYEQGLNVKNYLLSNNIAWFENEKGKKSFRYKILA